MEFYDDISSVVEETNGMLCRNRKRNYDGDDDDNNDEDEGRFKSKNLKAERKRREKLKSRMLELRSLVPKITNAMILNNNLLFQLLHFCFSFD